MENQQTPEGKIETTKELFANLIVKNAKEFSNESLKRLEVLEMLNHDASFKLMYKLCVEFSANINELAEDRVKHHQEANEELKSEMAQMIGAIEELSVGASTKRIELYFFKPGDEKPTIIHPDKVNGIYEGVRQKMVEMAGFGRRAVESHYRIALVENNLAKSKEANAKLVEALRKIRDGRMAERLEDRLSDTQMGRIAQQVLQTYETK